MHKKTLIFAVIIVFLFAVFIKFVTAPAKKEKEIIPPINTVLSVFQGANNEPYYMSVGVFSAKIRQGNIDAQIKKNSKNNEKANEEREISIKYSKSMWKNNVTFWICDEKEKKNKLGKGIKLLSFPKDDKLCFTSDSYYNAIYEVPKELIAKKCGKVFIEMEIGSYVVTSNEVIIPEKTSNEYDDLIRKAEAEIFLEKYDKLMSTAEKIISLKNDSYIGYWYKGISLEMFDKSKEAFESYKIALKNYSKLANREYPEQLIQKIKELSRIAK